MFTKSLKLILLVGAVLLLSVRAWGDDTEIFFAKANDQTNNKPSANVMILIDTSGSMRWCDQELGFTGNQPTWCSTVANRRIQAVQDAFDNMIDSVPAGVRVGLGRFHENNGGGNGGYIVAPVMDLTSTTKQYLKNQVAAMNSDGAQDGSPEGGTPTSEAYYEIERYMMGESPYYGSYGDSGGYTSYDNTTSVCVNPVQQKVCYTDWQNISGSCDTSLPTCQCPGTEYNGVCYGGSGWNYYQEDYQTRTQSDTGTNCVTQTTCATSDEKPIVQNGDYVSPMNMANQCETNHILIMTDGAPSAGELAPGCSSSSRRGASIQDSYDCQTSIASYLNSDTNVKKRRVNTSFIGIYMGAHESDMTKVSAAGGGATYNADSADAINTALLKQLNLIDKQAHSISAPGVSVNQANRLEYLDQLYYSVFEPESSSVWKGNLKRYRIDSGGVIRDVNDMDAIDPNTGFFSTYSKSWWSSDIDGADVTKGGAVEQLANRKIFYTTDSGGPISQLTSTIVDSSTFPASNFGIPSSNADPRYDTKDKVFAGLETQWDDPLHSVPLVVNYSGGNNTNAANQTNYVFVSTNGGMLRAIDPNTGKEMFSFMPHQELSKAYDFLRSPPLLENNIRSIYGMDSSWVAWRRPTKDSNGNDTGTAKSVYIYGGMRRGGDSYFALDVSDINSPKMLWQIDGGYGGSTATSGFSLLGQTWSVPTLTQVNINGTQTPVLVFGGGYDAANNDTAGVRSSEDDYGRAVYMVNAKTGKLIWSASAAGSNTTGAFTSVSSMKWSVPGSVSVVDMNFDGDANYLYFADTGGQVFRVNINNDNTGADGLVSGVTRIAALGGTAVADQRRFYSSPTISELQDASGNLVPYVAIGSGYRAHPLDENTDERAYVFADPGYKSVGGSQYPITNSDLTQIDGSTYHASALNPGWYFDFTHAGEKVLAPAAFENGYVGFTSYAPTVNGTSSDPCTVQYGSAYIHWFNALTGNTPAQETAKSVNNGKAPMADIGADGYQLKQSTIPPGVTTLYLDNGAKKVDMVGTQVLSSNDSSYQWLRRNRWYIMGDAQAQSFMTP